MLESPSSLLSHTLKKGEIMLFLQVSHLFPAQYLPNLNQRAVLSPAQPAAILEGDTLSQQAREMDLLKINAKMEINHMKEF